MSKAEDTFRDLERKLNKAATKLSEAECELEEVREDVRDIRKTQKKGRGKSSGARSRSSRGSNAADARNGIRQVLVERQNALGIIVHMDERTLELGAAEKLLAVLLASAAKEGGGSPRTTSGENGYVPMKTIDELLDTIEQRTGERLTEGVLRTHVARLRRRMAEARISRKLLETGTRSYRLRLRDDGRIIE